MISQYQLWQRLFVILFARGALEEEKQSVADDILEIHEEWVQKKGPLYAYGWLLWQFSGYYICMIKVNLYRRFNMIESYVKVGVRHFWKNRLYTLINLIGMSVAVAWGILVFCYMQDELNYNRFHEHIDQIALLNMVDSRWDVTTPTHSALGPALVADYAEIESSVRFNPKDSFIKVGNDIQEANILGTDPTIFTMYNFPLKWGDAEIFKSQRHVVYLTEEISQKHFGEINPVGRLMHIKIGETYQEFEIAGVFKKIPSASSLYFSYVVPIQHFIEETGSGWGDKTATMIQVDARFDLKQVLENLEDLTQPYKAKLAYGEHIKYQWMPFSDYHLNDEHFLFAFGVIKMPGSLKPALILMGLALLILLLAAANYVNLSLACLMRRFREIGVRKIMGAARMQIIRQLISESLIMILSAFATGVVVSKWVMPAFRQVTGKTVTSLDILHPGFLIFSITLLLGLVLLTALYPALVLSRMHAIEVLQKRHRLAGRSMFSKALIVIQFGIAVLLICVTLIINRQHRFMMQKQFGADADHVIALNLQYSINTDQLTYERIQEFKGKLLEIPGVMDAACTAYDLGGAASIRKNRDDVPKIVFSNQIEANFISLVGLKYTDGGLSGKGKNERAIIVSEGYALDFMDENPLGKVLKQGMYKHSKTSIVSGIVEDFNVRSLKYEVNPQVMEINPHAEFTHIFVRIDSAGRTATVQGIRDAYAAHWPDTLIDFYFLSDKVSDLYKEESRWNQIIQFSATLAQLIACSGLLGLTLLTMVHRSKEISIRRVLGASSGKVLELIQSQFLFLVGIGTLIACPLSYLIMRNWLEDFAFRTDMPWWLFAYAAFIVIAIAMLTVGFQTLLNIRQNPVKNLRIE